jgi:hypothetical protein
VLDRGVVRQQGSVAAVFAAPADADTARLLGYDNVLEPAAARRLRRRRPRARSRSARSTWS